MTILYNQSLENYLPQRIVAQEAVALEDTNNKVDSAIQSLIKKKDSNSLPLLNIAEKTSDLPELQKISDYIRGNFKSLVIIGTGGSILNPKALLNLADPNNQPVDIHCIDNVDPNTIDSIVQKINLEETAFLLISKSGGTLETLSAASVFLGLCQNKLTQKQLADNFFVITETQNKTSPLYQIAKKIGATIIQHEPIGGRFSSLTNVGLLPAMVGGLDASKFRKGAEQVIEQTLTQGIKSPVAQGAAVNYMLMKNDFPIFVTMPYIDRLADFASWQRQTWAESLGKNGVQTTAIKAAGTIDQHSQLQLYLDGKHDKAFTVITIDHSNLGHKTDIAWLDIPEIAYLNDKNIGDILTAEQIATTNTLINRGCPVRTIELNKLDEEVLGALLMHSMLEIIIIADLLQVNAFDQPAVEDGKILTRKLLQEQVAA